MPLSTPDPSELQQVHDAVARARRAARPTEEQATAAFAAARMAAAPSAKPDFQRVLTTKNTAGILAAAGHTEVAQATLALSTARARMDAAALEYQAARTAYHAARDELRDLTRPTAVPTPRQGGTR